MPACDRQTGRQTDRRIQTDRQTDGIAIASTALAMRALRRAVTSGQSNLTLGHIVAADGRFSCIRQVSPICPHMRAHWRHLANMIELLLPSAHQSPQPKRQIDRFSHFGRPFVKRFALCYQTAVCLSVLSVTLLYCGKTVGWIKIKLGMLVDLGPGHIVLYGDPAALSQRGTHQFWPISDVAKWLNGSRCHLVGR